MASSTPASNGTTSSRPEVLTDSFPQHNIPTATEPRKRRRKTFTGCWTCRSRHVKCDEQRPECKRCLAGHFACQGYGTRLTWLSSSSDRVPATGNRRTPRVMGPVAPSTTAGHGSSPGNAAQNGWPAFTVFPSKAAENSTGPGETIPARPGRKKRRADNASSGSSDQSASDEAIGPRVKPVTQSSVQPVIGDDLLHSFSDILESFDPSQEGGEVSWPDASQPWSADIGGDVYQPLAVGLTWPDYPGGSSTESSTSDSPDAMMPWQFDMTIGSPRRQLSPSPAPARQRVLINHWATNLSHKLLPIRSLMNPYLATVSPVALEGSRCADGQSSSSVALFHAVCAISAAHLENLGSVNAADKALTLHHKQQSFYHLMNNIHSVDLDERMASLATLCLWLLTHFISGEPGAWREVVKVTRNLLATTPNDMWNRSATASITYQSFSSFITLAQCQYFGRNEYPDRMEPALAGSSFYRTLATPDQSLGLISSFHSKLLRSDVLTPEELDRMEIEFALSAPAPPANDGHGQIAEQYLGSLFYNACFLYFRCVSGRRGPEEEIQDLVARCLDYMESLEGMKMDGTPRIWVYAAVAFEANSPALRSRVRKTFDRRKTLGFKSWDAVMLAVEEVWRQRDTAPRDHEPEPWPRLLAKMPDFDVIFY